MKDDLINDSNIATVLGYPRVPCSQNSRTRAPLGLLASKFHRLYSKYNPVYTSGRYGLSPPADVA